MKNDLLHQAAKYNKIHQHKKLWYRVLTCLAAIVVFCTTYALILPAITLEKSPTCGKTEHVHGEECYVYETVSDITEDVGANVDSSEANTEDSDNAVIFTELVCDAESLALHVHMEMCVDSEENVICGYADFVVHEHNEICYGESGELRCTLPEIKVHEHEDACYTVTEVKAVQEGTNLTAEQDVPEAASVPETVSTPETTAVPESVPVAETTVVQELICQETEIILHEHVEKCFDANGALICGLLQVTEHVHTEACLHTVEVDAEASEVAATESSEDANDVADSESFSESASVETNTNLGESGEEPDTVAILICGLEEHTHDEILCFMDDSADVENAEQWEATLPEQMFICGKAGHVHSDSCSDGCELTEHIHTEACAPAELTEEELQEVAEVIALIDTLPTADEADAAMLAYEKAENWSMYETYFVATGQQGRKAYEAYMLLSDTQKLYVHNYDKLMDIEYIWSAAVLIDEIKSDSPTTVKAASTSEFIELNLYDYGSNINDKYNSNNKYPGFQWNGGAYLKSTYDRHVIDYIDFGNSMITDLTYGSSGSGANLGYSNNRKIVGNQGGAINALDVSDYGVTNRPIGMSLNSSITDISKDVLLRTLGSDGYPALTDGTSLAYLFQDGTYADKKNTASIDGLFRQDETIGEYHYNSRENHAQYSNNKFTLYNQIITPNFITYPFGNFLPLNDITNGSNATQVSRITRVGGGDSNNPGYVQQIINDLIYASDYSSNPTKIQLLEMLVKYREDLQSVTTSGSTAWETWNAKNAIVDYFTTDGGDNPSDDTSLITDPLLSKMYNIDWDVKTNFFFGMEMKMNFMQPKGGMTGNDTNQDGESDYPMKFYFTGDDDVWVYIDGVLFLDLSGIHRHVGGEIDFVNGKVHYYYLDTANTGDVSKEPYKTYTFAEILSAAGKSTDGLNSKTFKDYTTHSFKFYYMERGSGSSVCRLNFNFPLLRQNTISVAKELTVDEQDKLALLGNPDFKFQILKADSNGTKTENLFIAAGVHYDIYDEDDNKIGTGTTGSNGVFTLKAGQRAEFNGIKENAGKYYVRELLDTAVFEQYGEIMVDGTSVTTTESDVTIDSVTFTGVSSPVKEASDGSTFFHFNNQVEFNKLGSLEIQKVLETYPRTRLIPEFEFEVTLDGDPVTVGMKYTVEDADGNKTEMTVDTEGIIVVPAGFTARIEKIIAGTKFVVRETSASVAGYTVIYSGSPGVTTDGDSASGMIILGSGAPESKVRVTVTNSENGTSLMIPVKKNISNPDGTEHTFKFKLEEVTDTGGVTLVENGVVQEIEIIVTDTIDQSFSLSYLEKDIATYPAIFYYRITEVAEGEEKIDYDESIYVIEVTVAKSEDGVTAEITDMWKDGKSVTEMDADTSFTAEFTNELLADLTLQKVLSGISSDTAFEFKLKLVDGDGVPFEGAFTAIKSSEGENNNTETVVFEGNGDATIYLKANESITIQNLPYGASWTVTEVNAEGFHTSWLIDSTGPAQSGSEVDGILTGSNLIICINEATYVLPNTGGTGTNLYTMGGLLTLTAAGYLLLCEYKKRRKEDSASS